MKSELNLKMGENAKIQWFDTLRALAIVAVIAIHVTSPLVNMTYGRNMNLWWIGNILQSFERFGVPTFLMLSGATLLGKEYTLRNFYQRRFSRVLIPFLFWMAAYWVYRWCMLYPHQRPYDPQSIVNWGVDLFLKEGISKHLWYVYLILAIYLFVPILNRFVLLLSRKTLFFVVLIWFAISYSFRLHPINQYDWTMNYDDKALGYFMHAGYLVLGYYLSKLSIISLKIKLISVVTFIYCFVSTAILTYLACKNAHKLSLASYSYFTIFAVLQMMSFFLIFKDTLFQNKMLVWLINIISNYSFGIYLVHIMVIGIFFRYGIFWTMAYPLISIPLVTVLTLMTSLGVIFLVRKIPFGKYIAG